METFLLPYYKGDLGKDPSMSQLLREGGSGESTPCTSGVPNSGSVVNSIPNQDGRNGADKKKKEVCKFYPRGHCNRSKECRFDHPNICQKFRQFGRISNDSKGCDGKCNAFHPNACRRSLKDKTCSFPDCRFITLNISAFSVKLLN